MSDTDDYSPTGGGNAHAKTYACVCAIAILAIHGGLLAWAATCHSPTLNEPGHLVAGLSNWEFGRFDVYRVNPPLVRMLAAVPALASQATTDWTRLHEGPRARPEFNLGEDFVAANGERSFWLFTLARWICIPFSLLGGYICYRWATELYGAPSGLFALTLWCFCPNILAHGQLITPDVAATSLGLAACYTFWCWLKQPSWQHALFSGLVLGIAELAKMTLAIFLVLWPALWIIYRWSDRGTMNPRDWGREFSMLMVRTFVAIYILNLGYGFEGTGTRLGDFRFVSATLGAAPGIETVPADGGNRFADSWLGALPMPLPKNYVSGMDLQKRDFEDYYQPSYLCGRFSPKGWWYYYLYALAVKVPLGTWLLIGMAGGLRLWKGRDTSYRDGFFLLCPAAIILIFVSSQTGFNQHMRYVLPAFPFVFVWTSQVARVINKSHLVAAAVAVSCLGWSAFSSLAQYPHSLSYFNELAGGPLGGPEHLICSNVDWGQDLLYLKNWLSEHPEARPIKLAYFGYFDPIHAGVEYAAPDPIPTHDSETPQPIPPGWYAISVNFVRGFPYFTYNGSGAKVSLSQGALAGFQKLEPVARAGYSIYIYHVPENESF